MAKQRVPLHQNPRNFVTVEDGATKGAQVGVDLRGPDGTVLRPDQIINPTTSTDPNANRWTVWKLIREVPANLVKIAALVGKGFLIRRTDGEWALRTFQQGPGIEIANPDGEAGNPTIGLADVPDSGAGTLLAITKDAKGRITGTKPATITGTAQQIEVANGDAVAGLPTLSLAAEVLASLGKADSAVQEVLPGTNVTVDNTDPRRPVISATASGGFVPYFIPDGQTFVVPAYQQALFTLPIEFGAGSSIELDGALVEVS
ncbi:hypothetical protein [Stenotrophomonas maltophilia]|uniref:hypothetical protein n=1 Tax=Stenotrophomonas maltophilia group TaxID=995085 RepID=UPI00070D845A|nr:hypothetical protein [Stenotrophomonas maltophilia]KRG61617.1 hypothetical protein ARC02_02770 [Stenotrophomonas maltophilia]NNH46598.1 hypothetical protein [Stenotrophomonas maltophilia]VEE52094.1 Uncharacterised protein [Stenotrophomonas maltophilia]